MLPSLPRVSRRASTTLSYVLSLITLPILVAITVFLPRILRLYVQVVYTPELAASPNLMEKIPVMLIFGNKVLNFSCSYSSIKSIH